MVSCDENGNFARNGVKIYQSTDLAKKSPQTKDTEINKAKQAEKEADFLHFQGNLNAAEQKYLLAIKLYGKEKALAVESLYNLGRIYHKQIQYDKAEKYYKTAYLWAKNIPDKAELLSVIMNNLSSLYNNSTNSEGLETILLNSVFKYEDSIIKKDLKYVKSCLMTLENIYTTTNRNLEAYKTKLKLHKIDNRYLKIPL